MKDLNKKMKDTLRIPKELIWAQKDWEDLYFTLKRFKMRFWKRRKLDEPTKD